MDVAASAKGKTAPTIVVRRWLMFLGCIAAVWVFMFVLAPAAQRVPHVGSLAASIEQTGINASALYYTGVEETAEAGMYLHNAEEYNPSGPR